MNFPSLDFSRFSDSAERDNLCTLLANGLKDYGFVKIRNHGISDEKIERLFNLTKQFFDLPLETKMSVPHPAEANPNRGYSFVGQENISQITGFEKGLKPTEQLQDAKETFDMGKTDDARWKNVWVDEPLLPGFRQFMEDFNAECHQIQLQILRALAIGLRLPESYFDSLHSRGENESRIIHYPPIPVKKLLGGRTTRIAEHTDFGTITLLFQDSTGGLEVEDQANLGTFHAIESSTQSEIILNVGDSLQRWTNSILRSASHRVTIPLQMRDITEGIVPDRYSVAYFCKPNVDVSLRPLPHFVSEDQPCKYGDITAWDYNQSKLMKVFS